MEMHIIHYLFLYVLEARASMPGMMDTVLNLGMNDEVAKGFTEATQNPRFVYDSYRRLFKCLLMLLWDSQKAHLNICLIKSKKKKVLNLILI